MLLYFALGVLVLVLGLALLRAFVEANPAKLAHGTRVAFLTVAVTAAALVFVVLLASGRLGLGFAELGGIAPLLIRGYRLWRRQQPASAPPPRVSEVETDYLRMTLDHDAGTMSGTVRRDRFEGRDLGELNRSELVALWRECRAADAQGASLMETYLDRLMPDWRTAAAGAGQRAAAAPGDAMTTAEALAILDLKPGAGEAEIREAYHRLMLKLHPDQGGSTYLAAKLNRAREVLLGR